MLKNNLTVLLLMIIIGSFSFQCKKEISCRECAERSTEPNSIANAPAALAGPDQEIVLPANSVLLDGSGSTDADSNIVSYHWMSISGATRPHIADANAIQTQASNFASGVYLFELTVTDADGLLSTDTMKVVVTSPQDTCDIDRPVINVKLVPLGKLSMARMNMLAAAANNKIVFAGGFIYDRDSMGNCTRRVDIYDIHSNSWSVKDLDPYPTWRYDMSIAASDNRVFIAGGGYWGDDIYTNQVDIYNTANGSWSSDGLSEYRSAATGVTAGNKVFFAGGFSFDNGVNYWSNTIDIYDDAKKTWTTGTLSERRGYVSAVAAGNKIYFAGGQKNDGQLLMSDRIDEYDMLTNSWSTSTLHEPLAGLAAISAGNKVFFAGGYSKLGESGIVEIRDIVTGAKSFACIIPRSGLTAVLKNDEIVFFTGIGSDARNGNHFEIYNLTTDTWSTGLLDKRIEGAAIISVNDVIYVAGGVVDGVGSDQVWKLEF